MNASQQPREVPATPVAGAGGQPADPAPAGYHAVPTPLPAAEPRRKSPALACILSVVPGLGQIYVGYYGLGFVHSIVVAVLISMMIAEPVEELMALVVIFFIFFMLYNIVDAGRRASLFNMALAGVPGVEMPEPMKMPRPGGSIFGGLVLIGVGFILLLHTRFDFSLDWIEQWWPVAPMIFGGYLLSRAIQERRTKE